MCMCLYNCLRVLANSSCDMLAPVILRSGGAVGHTACHNLLAVPLCSLCRKTLATHSQYTHFGFSRVREQDKAAKVEAVFSSVARRYDVMNDVMSLGIHRVWKDIFVRRLAVTSRMQVLDMAGGTGDIAFRILARQLRLASLDPVVSEVIDPVVSEVIDPVVSEVIDRPTQQSAMTSSSSSKSTLSSAAPNYHSQTDIGAVSPRYPSVLVCDINNEMLVEGERRAVTLGLPCSSFYSSSCSSNNHSPTLSSPAAAAVPCVGWMRADAEQLPLADGSFDAYTIAFGVRNVTHIDQALMEAYRVLRPGGRFLCLEFSHVDNTALRWLYDQYSFQLIPPLGLLVSGDWHSYQYLIESIRQFPSQEKFADMIAAAGFRGVTHENLSAGIVAIHSGFKL